MKITFDNWTFGLWTAGPTSKAPKGTLTRMQNVEVNDEGSIKTRRGCSNYVTIADTVDGAFVANTHFFKDSSGNIYTSTGVDTTIDQTGRRLRIIGMPRFGLADDIVFFPISMKKWYDSTVSNWGISKTPNTPLSALGAAGQLTGDYTYRLAFYNSSTLVTGALSDYSTELSPVAQQIDLDGIPNIVADSQVTHVNIYRTAGGIDSSWYYVDRVALGTSTYTDNIPDLGLGDLVSIYMMAPPTANVAARYKNRMLLFDTTINPRYGYVSLAYEPEVFHETQYDLVANSGDTVEAAIQVGDYCYIFGKNAIYQLQVDSSGLIATTSHPTLVGTPNGRTIAAGGNGIFYLGYDGIYLLKGFTSVIESLTATKMSDNINALFRGIDRGGLSTIYDMSMTFGTYVGGRYYFTYYGNDLVWHTLVYNETRQRWKHFTGWLYTAEPITGAYPIVGLENSVGLHDQDETDDDGTAFATSCGFNLLFHGAGGLAETALYDVRRFRISVQSEGLVTVSFYDGATLKYSVVLDSPTFGDAYTKHSVPADSSYFTQPEVRVSSTEAFTLQLLEVDIYPVRKHLLDYSIIGSQVEAGGE